MEKRITHTAAPPPNGDPLEFVMSDASVDRMGDSIEPDGWDLTAFRRNPVALFSHNASFPIGKWSAVAVRDGRLVGRLELMEPVSERLREVNTAVAAGVLRAVSVGFHAKKYEPLEGSKSGGLHFLEQELVECSLVSVPANANALALAKALGIPGDSVIFGVPAGMDRQEPIKNGVPAIIPNRKSQQMNVSEHVQSARAEVVGLRDQLTTIIEGGEIDRSDEITSRIETAQAELIRWERAEKALGNTSEQLPTTRPYAPSMPAVSAPSKPWAVPKKVEEPGYLWIRHCVVKTLSRLEHKPFDVVLHERYGSYGDFEATKETSDWFTRAATAPATMTTTGWATELAQTQYGEFFSQLFPGGIYGPLAPKGFRVTLGRNRQISMPTSAATPTVAGSFVAEGAPIPVRQAALTTVTLGLKKMAVIVTYTREIAEHSTPQIETIIRELITSHTQVAVDTVLIDATAADTIRPAGLRNGVSGLTATAGGGFNALVGDIKQMINVLAAANSLRSPTWIMHPSQAVSIGLTQNAGGDFPFKAEINSNTLQGYPVIVSSTCTLGMVILLDAADFMTVVGDDPRFDVSDQATLHMEDTTPLAIGTVGSPATVAAPARSLYQTDSIGLRMLLPMNWGMRRTGVITYVTAVTW